MFVLLYAFGFSLLGGDLRSRGTSSFILLQAYNFMLLAGLYVVHGLTVMLTIFASVDAVSGEITSHTIQIDRHEARAALAGVVRQVAGLRGDAGGLSGVTLGGCAGRHAAAVRLYTAQPSEAIGLLLLEALVLLSLSLLAGTRLSTLSNGVALFMLYGLTFIGTWVEQMGALLGSPTAVRIGSVASWVLPVEALWRRAAFALQPGGALSNNFLSPFAAITTPDPKIVLYAVAYAAVALGLALFSFSRRDL